MAYAKEITREYLESLGVRDVFPLLHRCYLNTDKEGPRIKDALYDGHYYIMQLYDPNVRAKVDPSKRDFHDGEIYIPFHRLVYAWFKGKVPTGMVVDHIDDDKLNNDPNNLQLLTPAENIAKNRPGVNTREIKCKLSRPLAYYETELEIAIEEYELAKNKGDAIKAHRMRSMISYRRAQIRYYKKNSK